MMRKSANICVGIPDNNNAWSTKWGPKSNNTPAPGVGNSLCTLGLKVVLYLSKDICMSKNSPIASSLINFWMVKKSASYRRL